MATIKPNRMTKGIHIKLKHHIQWSGNIPITFNIHRNTVRNINPLPMFIFIVVSLKVHT